MRNLFQATIAVFVLLCAPATALASGPPGWQALADCAAAYRANSEIPDPNRAPSMKASISDEGDAYAKAATGRFRQQTKASDREAGQTVKAYVAKRVPYFSRQPRSDVEHFIEACPQIGD